MWWDRERWWTVLIPPVTAAALVLLYFWAFDRWDQLENPVASQLAPLAGVIGFAAGVMVTRARRWEMLAVPFALGVAVIFWALFAPHDTPEDDDFRTILAMLAVVIFATGVVVNMPQIMRGRYAPPSDEG